MTTRHIAFFSFPHFPHINPTLSLVATLIRRGHRVSYVTADRFAANVTELGAEVLSCQDPLKLEGYPSSVVDWTIRIISDTAAFYEHNRPDLVVYDSMCHAGRIFAREQRIPAIQTSPAFAVNELEFTVQVPAVELRELILEGDRRTDRLFEHRGIAKQNCEFHREALNICFYPKAFELAGNEGDTTLFYAGRCAPERPYRQAWKSSSCSGRPLLIVSTSTFYTQTADYFRMCIEALSGLKWHVVLAIGHNNDAAAFGPLPPHFEIVQNVPQIQILPYASMMICLGGMITTVEAMYHGVPLIMLTHGHPEPEWYGNTFEKLGLGIHIREHETNVAALRSAVLRISESAEIADGVRHMQRVVRKDSGGEETANRIEDYLEQG